MINKYLFFIFDILSSREPRIIFSLQGDNSIRDYFICIFLIDEHPNGFITPCVIINLVRHEKYTSVLKVTLNRCRMKKRTIGISLPSILRSPVFFH